MSISHDNFPLLEQIVHDHLGMLQRAAALAQSSSEYPEHEGRAAQLTEHCHVLFGSMAESCRIFRLAHLIHPVEAMVRLLDQTRSGMFTLNQQHLALLVEFCRFVEQGLNLVLEERSDERLASAAESLTAAIIHSDPGAEAVFKGHDGEALKNSYIRDAVISEIEDLLVTVEQEFVLWDFISIDHLRVEALCRLLNRLEKNFTQLTLQDLARLCLSLETTLTRFLQGDFFQTEYPERVFLRTVDAMLETLNRFARLGDATVDGVEQYLASLQALIRKPIGALLVEAGLVPPQVLKDALEVQKSLQNGASPLLGELLVDMGEVTPDQVRYILQGQERLASPIPLSPTKPDCADLSSMQVRDTSNIPADVSPEDKKSRIVALIDQIAARIGPDNELTPLVAELQKLIKMEE